jgi:hypothetical protein
MAHGIAFGVTNCHYGPFGNDFVYPNLGTCDGICIPIYRSSAGIYTRRSPEAACLSVDLQEEMKQGVGSLNSVSYLSNVERGNHSIQSCRQDARVGGTGGLATLRWGQFISFRSIENNREHSVRAPR